MPHALDQGEELGATVEGSARVGPLGRLVSSFWAEISAPATQAIVGFFHFEHLLSGLTWGRLELTLRVRFMVEREELGKGGILYLKLADGRGTTRCSPCGANGSWRISFLSDMQLTAFFLVGYTVYHGAS